MGNSGKTVDFSGFSGVISSSCSLLVLALLRCG